MIPPLNPEVRGFEVRGFENNFVSVMVNLNLISTELGTTRHKPVGLSSRKSLGWVSRDGTIHPKCGW